MTRLGTVGSCCNDGGYILLVSMVLILEILNLDSLSLEERYSSSFICLILMISIDLRFARNLRVLPALRPTALTLWAPCTLSPVMPPPPLTLPWYYSISKCRLDLGLACVCWLLFRDSICYQISYCLAEFLPSSREWPQFSLMDIWRLRSF